MTIVIRGQVATTSNDQLIFCFFLADSC